MDEQRRGESARGDRGVPPGCGSKNWEDDTFIIPALLLVDCVTVTE